MAFWDELGQKITKGSQGALQKTRDMASVVSLNADISDSRSRIRDLYEELGGLIMQNAFTQTNREELQEMIDSDPAPAKSVELENWKDIFARIISIRSEEEKIALNRQKVSTLKNETKCPGCGTKVSKGTLFCPQCGTKIIWPEPVPEAAESVNADETGESVTGADAVPEEELSPAAEETASAADAGSAAETAAEPVSEPAVEAETAAGLSSEETSAAEPGASGKE